MVYRNLKMCLFVLLLFSSGFQSLGQDPEDVLIVQNADAIYDYGAKKDALEQYLNALQINPNNLRGNLMAGICYLETINKERAVNYLLKAYQIDPKIRFDILYLIGRSYQLGSDFDHAITYFEKYKEKLKAEPNYRGKDKVTTKEVDRSIVECHNGKEIVSNPLKYSIKNIGNEINSDFPEFAPLVNADETIMVFTSRREDNISPDKYQDNEFYEDIFIAKKVDGKWSDVKNLGEGVNTKYHDSGVGLSADGKTLYLRHDDNGGDIYSSELQGDGTWSKPSALKGINSPYSENSVSISSDGNILFFSSDRPGGFGNLDLYYSILDKKGNWSTPKNLGSKINTESNDDGPFIDYDKKSLFFSSKGHKGIGGYDIFMSEYDSALLEWKDPINIGYPVNTPDDDIYFVKSVNKNSGYYASVKNDGVGEKDIYTVVLPSNYEELKKLTSKKETQVVMEKQAPMEIPVEEKAAPVKEPEVKKELKEINVVINIKEEVSKQLIDAKVSVSSKTRNIVMPLKHTNKGVYSFSIINEEPNDFVVSIEKEGYMFRTETVSVPMSTDSPKNLKKTFTIGKLRVGFASILRNIYFDNNKATFKIESYSELNKLENLLKENPNYKIKISGHTDNIGDAEFNKHLSQKRANAVVEYLKRKGVDARRLTSEGYGEEKPLASNDDEKDGRELNRRTEFKIIGEQK
ncbi:MAG TPA: OmpA family protein [Cytophagales bacterium]|nr:OmpA family protein [Cytophagales bacterium]